MLFRSARVSFSIISCVAIAVLVSTFLRHGDSTYREEFNRDAMIYGRAEVVDGDTISISKLRVRLKGIDAPESNQKCSKENGTWDCGKVATKKLRGIIGEKPVTCVYGKTDRYRRPLGVCSIDGMDISAFMIKNGWAIVYMSNNKTYISLESEAKYKKVGLWQGAFQEPWLWRKAKKL